MTIRREFQRAIKVVVVVVVFSGVFGFFECVPNQD
jgi:hypothetical protein